jgi:hypothetical protein
MPRACLHAIAAQALTGIPCLFMYATISGQVVHRSAALIDEPLE